MTRSISSASSGSSAPVSGAGDVIVVGAGPTGLLLAGDLASSGHRVTLLERRASTTSNLTRALVVHARTLEQLDARGLADELVRTGHPIEHLQLFGNLSLDATKLHSRFPFVLVVPQFEVERLLERRAREAGVTFRHAAKVTALRQDAHGVEVELAPRSAEAGAGAGAGATGEAGTAAETLRASYLVGTDGAHSTVRGLIGLPFPGKSVLRSIVLADVRLAEAPASPFVVSGAAGAFALIGDFGDGWHRVMGWDSRRQLPDTEPAGLDEVKDFTRRSFGSDHGMHDARWISRFHSDERQAPAYRVGRVFLAGDAAHVHSPAGGMGMNTGLQDAANLGWKLAAVVAGRAPATLLDSYEAERHPVGKLVLRVSGAIIRAALTQHPVGRGLRALVTRTVDRVRPVADRAIGVVAGTALSYRAPRGSHPLVGKRVPDLALTSGRLYEALREGKFVLVIPPGAERRTLAGSAGSAGSEDLVVAESSRGTKRTLLVRPDGYLAWASDDRSAGGLREALAEWSVSAPEPEPEPVPTA